LRHQVYQVIRLHGKPPHALAETPEIKLALWSQDTPLSHLLEFVRCDLRGRVCADQKSLLLTADLLQSQAEELQCLDRPYAFGNPEAKIWANTGRLSSLNHVPHFAPEFSVHMLMGLPGSGKDTHYRKHLSHLPMISLDDLRAQAHEGDFDKAQVYSVAKEQARVLLARRQTFVFNATNLTRSLRLKWLNLFYQYHAELHGVFIEPSMGDLLRQNKSRERVVPEAVIRDMYAIMEYPSATEFHHLDMILAT
jgi:predicted kinase